MLSKLEFFITETVTSFRRHPAMAFAAITCVAAALFFAGLVGLGILNARFAAASLKDKVRFNVYFQQETTRDDATNAFHRIQRLPGVASAKFVDRQTGWEQMTKNQRDLPALIGDNPLPDAVEVKPTDISRIKTLAAELEKWPEVNHVQQAAQVSDMLVNIGAGINRVGAIAGIILAILSLVIIHHTIELTLYARRREIFIMSLVGATPTTIAMPFLLEGIIYGLIGAGVALGFVAMLYGYLINNLQKSYNAHLLNDHAILLQGIIVLLAGGLVLGLSGSLVSVIKYLNRPRSKVTNA